MFRSKTYDLGKHILKVAAFPHIPGIATTNSSLPANRASIKISEYEEQYFYGTEIEVNIRLKFP